MIRVRSEIADTDMGRTGAYVPYFVCEFCGKDIKEIGLAIFTHEYPPKGGYAPIHIWHKGACDPSNRGFESGPWDELSRLPEYLSNVYGVGA